MNRDLPLLTRIYATMQEIVSLERRSEWQYDRAFSVTKRLRGMPGGGGLPSGMDAVLSEVDELNHEYGERIRQYVYELKTAERILNAIPSPVMRTFVRMYYVDNLPKADVMRELNMTEWAFNKVRDRVEQAESMAKVRWSGKQSIPSGEANVPE